MAFSWSMTADEIGHCLARNLFRSDLVAVDRCLWPGNECDLLVVTPRLQVIDVEVKISRADLKADRDKTKWLESWDYQLHGWRSPKPGEQQRIDWPQNVWKHYYAMPISLWKPELAELCNPKSGVIVVDVCHPNVREFGSEKSVALKARRSPGLWYHQVVKRAKPNPNYEPISTADLRKIAYLASCRMWNAYAEARNDAEQRITESVRESA